MLLCGRFFIVLKSTLNFYSMIQNETITKCHNNVRYYWILQACTKIGIAILSQNSKLSFKSLVYIIEIFHKNTKVFRRNAPGHKGNPNMVRKCDSDVKGCDQTIHLTKSWLDFKWNWKNFQRDLRGVMNQELRICIVWNPRLKAWIGQVWLSCLAGHFYGLQSRISNKIYSEPLMHAFSPHKGPIESFFNFI